jgi:hypothetical protein
MRPTECDRRNAALKRSIQTLEEFQASYLRVYSLEVAGGSDAIVGGGG